MKTPIERQKEEKTETEREIKTEILRARDTGQIDKPRRRYIKETQKVN